MQIVFCGTGWLPIVNAIQERLPRGCSIRVRDTSRPLADELLDAQVILPSNARIDAAAVAAPRDLRLIQQPAVGIEGVDLEAARARGVPVCNAPGMNTVALSEATLLLLLACARRLREAQRAFAEAKVGVPLGSELAGKVLGLVGFGASGRRVALCAEALGMEVRHVRSKSSRADFEELLARADYVSLHCPLTPRTRGLFDDHAFACMKPGAVLVNCARAGIVDRAALERALDTGRLAAVGMDVFWAEPWDPADPLFAREDVITLPHVGGSTRESFARIATAVVDNVERVLRGEEPRHRVA